jgi:hypothetical protein
MIFASSFKRQKHNNLSISRLKINIYQLGGRGGSKKAFFIFPEIKI